MNASDIKEALDNKPQTIFHIRPRHYARSSIGRILEVQRNSVQCDRYGSRIKPRTVTTYLVEYVTQVRRADKQVPITYEIAKYPYSVSAREIEGVYSTDTTLETLCDERTASEREYQERMASDDARQEVLRQSIASRAKIDPRDLNTLVTRTLEALDKALDKNTTDNASLSTGGNNNDNKDR